MVFLLGRARFCLQGEASSESPIQDCGVFLAGMLRSMKRYLFEALSRELREEIGVAPMKVLSLGSIRDPNSGPADHVEYHMYIVPAWDGGEPHMVGDEHIELAWFTPQKAIALDDLALKEYRALLKMLPDT